MQILIIGAGAIGSLLGARLASAGHNLTLVGRAPFVAAVESQGLALTKPDGATRIVEVRAVSELAQAFDDPATYDLALLTVKAYDTEQIADEITTVLSSKSASLPLLLTMQNGVGNEELLSARLPDVGILAGAIDTPVSVPSPGRVIVHRDRFKIGLSAVQHASQTKTEQVSVLFAQAGFAVRQFADFRSLKWTKLLMNQLANASCALLDWTPAQVMADRSAAQVEALAWQETLRVIGALHVWPVNLAGYPFTAIAPVARRLPPTWLASLLRVFVSGGRGGKMPSLQMALSQGKRSEVRWLNGAVAHAGDELGVPTPVNRTLTALVAAASEGKWPPETLHGHPEQLLAWARAGRGSDASATI